MTRSDQARPDRERHPQDMLNLDRHMDGQRAVVSATGDLDRFTAPILRAALAPDALPDGCVDVVLDVSGLEFCDSTGYCSFVMASRQLTGQGGRLILLHPPEWLARRARMLAIDQFVPMHAGIPPR